MNEPMPPPSAAGSAHADADVDAMQQPEASAPVGAPVHGGLLARNTALNLVGLGLPMVVAVVAIPPLIRGMGTDRFGALAIAWMLLNAMGELGFGRATTKYMAEALGTADADRVAPTLWATAAIQAAFGVLCGLALAAVTPLLVGRALEIPPALEGEVAATFLLLAASLPVIMLAGSLRGALEAAQRFDLVNAVRVPASVANYALPLAAVALGWRLPGVLGVILASRACSAAAYCLLGLRAIPEMRGWPRVERAGLGRLARFGGWVTVSGVASPMLVYIDRLALGVLVTMTAVAYYAAPFEMVMRLVVLPSSVVAALFPAFSALHGRLEAARIGRLAVGAMKVVLVTLGPVVVLVMAGSHDILRLWLGPDFAREGTAALVILTAGILVIALAHVPYTVVQGMGRADLTGKFHLLELPVHAALVWWLVGALGIPGAALAWSLRALLDGALLFTAAGRLAGVPVRGLFAARIPQSALAVLTAGGIGAVLVPHLVMPAARALALTAVVAVSAAALWRYTLTAPERSRLVAVARAAAAAR